MINLPKKSESDRDFLLKQARNGIAGMDEVTFSALCASAVAHDERIDLAITVAKPDGNGYLSLRPMTQAKLALYYADHVMTADERDAALAELGSGAQKQQVPAAGTLALQVAPPAQAGPVLSRQWPGACRGIPSALIRCALFAAGQRQRGVIVRDGNELPGQPGVVVLRGATGDEWLQYDLSAVLQLVQIATERGHFKFGVDAMLQDMGIKPCQATRLALEKSLTRLLGAIRVDFDTDEEEKKSKNRFALLKRFRWATRKSEADSALQHCDGELSEAFLQLYLFDNVTRINWQQRTSLPVGLAQWLHAYYSSHKSPHPMRAETLANFAGLKSTDKKEVNRQMRVALAALQAVGFLVWWHVDRCGLVTVERSPIR